MLTYIENNNIKKVLGSDSQAKTEGLMIRVFSENPQGLDALVNSFL